MTLPPFAAPFVDNVTAYGGEQGRRWLAQLPDRVARAARHWRIDGLAPLPNLSFNYLASGNRGGDAVVVKFVSADGALAAETRWLALQRGRGAVRLLDRNEDLGAYLMERLVPGTPATDLADAAATAVIGTLIADLATQCATGLDLPRVDDWFADLPRFVAAPPPGIDLATIDAARATASDLAGDAPPDHLLHGDLHHHNVVAGEEGWRVVDAKCVAGDPAHECAALFRNRLDGVPQRAFAQLMRSRLAIVADCTGFDAARIAGWGFAQTVLACCWSVQANPRQSVGRELAVAGALRALCR